MASKDLLDDLAKRPPAVKLAILAGTLAVLGIGYWQLRYSSLDEDKTKADNQYAALQEESNRLKRDLAEWEELILAKERLDEKLKKIGVSLPASSELPSFFLNLQKQAAAAGVNVRSWKRVREIPIETYVKVPVEIEVTGTFYQINNYFYLLYRTDRIITVEDFTLSGARMDGDDLLMNARFRASTFRQADRPPDTSLPPAEAAPPTPAPAPTPPPAPTPAPAPTPEPSPPGGEAASGDGAKPPADGDESEGQ
jgi:type IV pilus assembly protein PilO